MSVLYVVKGFTKSFYRVDAVKCHITLLRKMSHNVIAVCQMTATNEKDKNFETVKRLVGEAKFAKAKIAFFPEACDFVGTSKEETFNLAESLDGPLVKKYQELAKSEKIWLSLGGLHESTGSNKLRNTHILLNDEGVIVGKYSKTHLFDVDIPSQNIRLMESSYIEKGSTIEEPVDTPVGKVGLSICYDMRFPELSLVLTRMGAEILTYPSAFTYNTGSCHWEVLLRAKAIETQCYVVAAAQTGMHNKKRSSWGHAMVVDPWGTIIAQCTEGEGIAPAIINLDYLKKVRTNLPVSNHRRNDLYPVMIKKNVKSSELKDYYDFGQVKISHGSIFYKTDLTIAFTNKRCVVPGHVLVAPIRTAKRLGDLTPEEVSDLFQVSQKVTKVMEIIHEATSSSVVVQDGPEAGQTIRHVHVHVLPRKKGDFAWNDAVYYELQKHDKDESKPWRSEEEMCKEAELIREKMADNDHTHSQKRYEPSTTRTVEPASN